MEAVFRHSVIYSSDWKCVVYTKVIQEHLCIYTLYPLTHSVLASPYTCSPSVHALDCLQDLCHANSNVTVVKEILPHGLADCSEFWIQVSPVIMLVANLSAHLHF